MPLKIDLRNEGAACIVSVGGEVDMESSPDLKAAISKALPGCKALRVRLSDVSYLDSSGIAVLVEGYKAARDQAVEFILLDPSAQVGDVIKLSQLDSLFRIEHSESS